MNTYNEFNNTDMQLYDGDTIVLTKEHTHLFTKCCDCGLWHKFEIERKGNGEIHLKPFRLDKEPDFNKMNIELNVIRGDS